MLKGWKTRIISAAIFISGLLEVIDPGVITTHVSPDKVGYILAGYAIFKYIMHEITLLENKPKEDV